MAALVGGGLKVKPGEVSLAHLGVLFLDELPEFQRAVLDQLRQPIETGEAVVARANAHVRYPARFQLVAAMNPCRCGYLSDPALGCGRAPKCASDYQSRISGPLFDRIDLHVEVAGVSAADLSLPPAAEGSAEVAARVAAAREIQRERFAGHGIRTNAEAEGELLDTDRHARCGGIKLLTEAAERMKLSARGYHRVLKVARTIADLAGAETVAQAPYRRGAVVSPDHAFGVIRAPLVVQPISALAAVAIGCGTAGPHRFSPMPVAPAAVPPSTAPSCISPERGRRCSSAPIPARLFPRPIAPRPWRGIAAARPNPGRALALGRAADISARSSGDSLAIASGVHPSKARPMASSGEGCAGMTPVTPLLGKGGGTTGGGRAVAGRGRGRVGETTGVSGRGRAKGRSSNSISRSLSFCACGVKRKCANSRTNRNWRASAAMAVATRSRVLARVLVKQPQPR